MASRCDSFLADQSLSCVSVWWIVFVVARRCVIGSAKYFGLVYAPPMKDDDGFVEPSAEQWGLVVEMLQLSSLSSMTTLLPLTFYYSASDHANPYRL